MSSTSKSKQRSSHMVIEKICNRLKIDKNDQTGSGGILSRDNIFRCPVLLNKLVKKDNIVGNDHYAPISL